jgi:hypothetical protein
MLTIGLDKGNRVFYCQVAIHGSLSSLNTVAFPQDVPKYLTSIRWKGLETKHKKIEVYHHDSTT